MREIEIIRIQHCDDPNCDLGQIQFDCPFCNKTNITCDGWYETEDFKDAKLKCKKCNHEFIVDYNMAEMEWIVRE
jgi:transcription elongation factor Elf1